ncbi:MAG TPA: undecaprenyl-diphosphate phosphatase [bacterium]|nr:undecaprenyl-diphosphate phosphatase [bacterium]
MKVIPSGIILRHFFGLEGNLSLDVFLHLSSLLVILIFFRKDIACLARALFRKGLEKQSRELVFSLGVASGVTAVVALVLRPHEELFSALPVVAAAYLVTGLLLFFTRREGREKIDWRRALLIGLVQGLAVLPGLSRSGSTIAVALATGVSREEAFRFSFLLAIPAISGAGLLEFRKIAGLQPWPLVVGMSVAFLLGLLSLSLLRRLLHWRGLAWFSLYCLALSLLCWLLR